MTEHVTARLAMPSGTLDPVPPYRDVAAFDDRADRYERGWRGRLHHEIADRTADLAVTIAPAPHRVLDVGCGTGYLLRALASRYPGAQQLAGIDAASQMVDAASAFAHDDRLTFSLGVAENLDYPDETFDLVVSTTSFDHWPDQQAGLTECARVLSRWPHCARRPVLVVAGADPGYQPPRQSPHQEPRHPSSAGSRIVLGALAQVVRGDH